MAHETAKAGPRGDAETDLQNAACLAACSALNTAHTNSVKAISPFRARLLQPLARPVI